MNHIHSASPLHERIVLLAPSSSQVPDAFARPEVNRAQHERLLKEMQRLRGEIYLADGAIQPWQLTADGRHRQGADERAWHVLALNQHGRVCGCLRFLQHKPGVSFQEMNVRHSALAICDRWGGRLERAVEAELRLARDSKLFYAEVGGWAIAEDRRCTSEALRIALSTYGLAMLLGGSLGITTATVRHGSSSILRRIGGRPLVWDGAALPPYYDPQYRCEMELLRFDSRSPEPKYSSWVAELQEQLTLATVICARGSSFNWRSLASPLSTPVLASHHWKPVAAHP